MANFFSNLAQKGLFGGGAGAYATNKKFQGGVNKFLFGEDPSLQKISNMNPQQEQLFSKLIEFLQGSGLGGATQGLQDYLDPSSEAYNRFEEPYRKQFQEQTLPGIAERFAGFGANSGALSSSGFGQALGGAASQFESNMAGLKEGMRGKAIQDILGLTKSSLSQEPFSYYENPGSQGYGAQIIAALIKGLVGGGGF